MNTNSLDPKYFSVGRGLEGTAASALAQILQRQLSAAVSLNYPGIEPAPRALGTFEAPQIGVEDGAGVFEGLGD